MELGLVRKVDIDFEMQQSYLDYAMSVIVARALPDARDGMKPVQRRVLFAMYDMGLRSNSTYKKSARIVGEVLGKYHPHGDVAVYESMARLAQDFSMRYGLVDGQGNFGSVDGDPPAAMRYTEARLSDFAMEMLVQIDRDTVDFAANFDGTLSEPTVLPAAAPNLLVNGASGIAVGMATSIPPHNLGEVVDALILMLHEWNRLDDISISDLMHFVQGPDFPTGGIILQETGQEVLLQAYATGRGRIKVRGRVQKEDMERGKSRLIISELPYQVNKSSLIERIADMVRENVLEGITDLRDEFDRQGMRIVIELKAGIDAEPVLLKLYQRTPLESTFGISLLALVDGEPRLLSLKQALRVYLEHRLVVIKRRSEHDLSKAQARAHILEGLRIALANLDEIIALIKAAPDVETARVRLVKRFKLSDIQAQAILDMQLRRLASLERKRIESEYKELKVLIKELETLLKSPVKMRQMVETELVAIRDKYADKRRTRIVVLKEGESAKELLTTNDMTPAQKVWIGVMEDGTIGRAHEDSLPRLSGRAAPRWLLRATTHHTLYLAAEDGRAVAVSVEAIPDVEKFADGIPLNKVSPFEPDDLLAAVVTLPAAGEIEGEVFIMTVTRMGMVKKSPIEELPGPSTQRFVLVKTNPGDSLGWVFLTGGNATVLLVTAKGMSIRFSEQDVRAMGLVAAGVNGIKLRSADQVIGAARLAEGMEMLALATNGKAWRVGAKEFPIQGRYGQGVQLCKLESGVNLTGILVGKRTQGGLVHFRQAAAKSVRVDEIHLVKRGRLGQEIYQMKTGEGVVDVTPVQDGLAFWKKSGPLARIREDESDSDDDDATLEIVEESQVQEALPGLETGENQQVKPASRQKSTPRSGRQAAKTRSKSAPRKTSAAASRQEKKAVSDAPLLQQAAEAEKPGPAEKPSSRRRKAVGTQEKMVDNQKTAPAAPEKTVRRTSKPKTAVKKSAVRTETQASKTETKAGTSTRAKAAPRKKQPATSPAESTPGNRRKKQPATANPPQPSPLKTASSKPASRAESGKKTNSRNAPSAPPPTKKPAPASSTRSPSPKGSKTKSINPAETHGWEQVEIPPVVTPEEIKRPARKKSSPKKK